MKSHFVTSKTRRGGRRKPPRVFTEQGVAMLSSVLRSERAAEVNVAIALFQHVKALLAPPPESTKPPIGFIHTKDERYRQ